MSTYGEIHQYLQAMRRPVRAELTAYLGEPQRKLLRVLSARRAQLQEQDDEMQELVELLEEKPAFRRFA